MQLVLELPSTVLGNSKFVLGFMRRSCYVSRYATPDRTDSICVGLVLEEPGKHMKCPKLGSLTSLQTGKVRDHTEHYSKRKCEPQLLAKAGLPRAA